MVTLSASILTQNQATDGQLKQEPKTREKLEDRNRRHCRRDSARVRPPDHPGRAKSGGREKGQPQIGLGKNDVENRPGIAGPTAGEEQQEFPSPRSRGTRRRNR